MVKYYKYNDTYSVLKINKAVLLNQVILVLLHSVGYTLATLSKQ